jgi:ATP-dependent protease ClpP protease subunit
METDMETTPAVVRETFSGRITPQTSEALVANMSDYADHDVERVVLDMSTPGGVVASGITLYKRLRSLPFELITYNTGEVASMGNIMFLAGDKRLASAEATFLLHPITLLTPYGPLDVNDLRQERIQLERTCGSSSLMVELDIGIAKITREEREVQTIFEERTNLTGPEIRELVQNHTYVSAAYACAVGIVHDVISARRS